jgi:hypothetical protein
MRRRKLTMKVKGHRCRLEGGGVNRQLKLLRKACTNAEIN